MFRFPEKPEGWSLLSIYGPTTTGKIGNTFKGVNGVFNFL
jgi:hypothetical protein